MGFLLAMKDRILSTHRRNTRSQLRYPAIITVSAGVEKVVDITCFLEIVLDPQFDGVATLVACGTVTALDWDELIESYSVPYVYVDNNLLVGLSPDRYPSYINNICPIRSNIGKEVAESYGTQRADLGTAEVTSIVVGPTLRRDTSPSTGAASARVSASSGLVFAVVKEHSSSSPSAQVSKVLLICAVAFSALSGLLSSLAVGRLSFPPLSLHGDTISEDL